MPCVIAVSLKVIADHNLVGGSRMKRGYVSESPGTFPTDGKVEGVCLWEKFQVISTTFYLQKCLRKKFFP